VTFQGLVVRFPLRAAEGPMTKDWLLNGPKREEADSGRHTQLLLHPTGSLAERFARCLACNGSRGWPAEPELAGLDNGSLLRRAVELAPSLTSHWLRGLPVGAEEHRGGLGFRCAADARHCASC
jgi:hypothetical protein